MDGDSKRVLLGAIAGAHGVRGEVKVKSFTEDPRDIAAYGTLQSEDGAATFEITDLKQIGKSLVARLKGVSDRSAAERLKGTRLYVPADTLPPAEDGSWYHADLIGLSATNRATGAAGTIIAVHNFGAGDLLEIDFGEGSESDLVPFNRETVPEVDIASGKVVIDWPLALNDPPQDT